MNTLLSVRNLSVTFDSPRGPIDAVSDVSFDIQPGETLGIVGESGCGKSVTALSILKLIDTPPGRYGTESAISFQGRNLLTLNPRDLRGVRGAAIGMIFQEPVASLNPVLTIGSQITETIRAHNTISKKQAKARALELLARVGISDVHDRYRSYPHQMSGGMLQRVMIAIALSCEPQLLIADEPTTALDVTVQSQIIDLLAQLQSETTMAMLFITHDLGVLAGIADRVAVMYGGRIVEQGTATVMYDSPAHPYTKGLMRAVPRIDQPIERLVGIPGSVPSARAWPPGCRFHPRCQECFAPCPTDVPPTFAVGPNHTTACWLHDTAHRATTNA